MSFPLTQMRDMNVPVARVVVAATQGSIPREIGASMLVTSGDVQGTIGGGALEYEAIARAREVLQSGADRLDRVPLGPGLGQCCGGSVTLLTEIWDTERLNRVDLIVARPLPDQSAITPMAVSRIVAAARNAGQRPQPGIIAGWMIEPIQIASREIWVWGAGHVGRALVNVLAPLPELQVRWADMDRARFPSLIPNGVEPLIAANPADLVSLADGKGEHFVLTYSHALDLEICHRVLGRSFRHLGLIGSATKRARFRKRLAALGHGVAQIDRMECPIGDPAFGKHPQAIALSVAVSILERDVVGAGHVEHRK